MDERATIERAVLIAAAINDLTWPSSVAEAEAFLTSTGFVPIDVKKPLHPETYICGDIDGLEAGWSVDPEGEFGLVLFLSNPPADAARTACLARSTITSTFGSADADPSDHQSVGATWTTSTIHLDLELLGREPEGPFLLLTIHRSRAEVTTPDEYSPGRLPR
jgi:hypothetical protein